jgi:hypothetical protein
LQLRDSSPVHGRVLEPQFLGTRRLRQAFHCAVIDVDDLDEAIAFAGRLPPAKRGMVEICPVFEFANLPEVKT